MRNIILGIIVALLAPAFAFAGKGLVLVGEVPSIYLEDKSNDGKTYLAAIRIEKRIITNELNSLPEPQATALKGFGATEEAAKAAIRAKFDGDTVVFVKSAGSTEYDVLYPGLIDLHNHTKQNNLGVWGEAQGQFENRFVWRAWSGYKKAVSGNMNPWIGWGKPITCAAFRWSEMQAMVLGTTYLQGPSSCIKDFGIHQVEDAKAYVSKKKGVQAPTDVVIPADMVFVWNTLGPFIKNQGMTYEQALAHVLTKGDGKGFEGCAGLREIGVTAENVNSKEILDTLTNQKALIKACGFEDKDTAKENLPEKFIRYVYYIHKTIAGRKSYFEDPKHSALIAHLAEGRREDAYNKREFELLEMLGLIRPHVNLVHAVGVDAAGFKKMQENGMGIVWSPFSNMLLYGETLDVKAALDSGVTIALGSDWVPTGARGVLEELKVAADYIDRETAEGDSGEVNSSQFTDELLYKMVTENPAKMINHWEITKGEAGIGRLAKGAMGTLIAVKKSVGNPYTNLVRHATEKEVNLVVIDGRAIYGNESYVQAAGEHAYEPMQQYFAGLSALRPGQQLPVAPSGKLSNAKKIAHLEAVGKAAMQLDLDVVDSCGFTEAKVFVHQDSWKRNGIPESFFANSGVDLDRFSNIQRLIGANMMTQTRNQASGVDEKYWVQYFPSLYSCNDPQHQERVALMVETDGSGTNSQNFRDRPSKLSKVAKKLKSAYPDL